MPPPKFNLKIQVSFFSWSLAIFILSHLTMTQWPKAKKKKLPGQFPGAAWSHPARTATHGITARCLHHGSIVIHRQRAGAERSSCWEHMPHPTPSWRPELSLAIWSSLDANSVSREMVEQKVPAPPPIPLPLSPNLRSLTALPPRDSIVS